MTHTYATLEVSAQAFDEIKAKLEDAGYGTALGDEGTLIDMHGIALVREIKEPTDEPGDPNEPKKDPKDTGDFYADEMGL